MSITYHHKMHTGAALPNMCPECDLELAWEEVKALESQLADARAMLEKMAGALKRVNYFEEDVLDDYWSVEYKEWRNQVKAALSSYEEWKKK